VPGCGSGHDALEFARAGRDTLGLDLAPTAVAKCCALQAADPDPTLRTAAPTRLAFQVADLFTWQHAPFAVAFDYTLVSALPPELWPKWADAMARLVAPGG
jgi:SAM-dependent methyltransferase